MRFTLTHDTIHTLVIFEQTKSLTVHTFCAEDLPIHQTFFQ